MFVVGNFLVAFGQVLDMALSLYMWIVIIRALLSWVSPDPYNPIVQFLYRITDPVMYQIQRRIPPMGGMDLSPMILIFGIYFARLFVVKSVIELGYRLQGGM